MAIRDDAQAAGVQFVLGSECTGVIPGDSESGARHTVKVNTGTRAMPHNEFIEAGHLVNCAGLYADRLAHQLKFGT